jgi:hypothetical protein
MIGPETKVITKCHCEHCLGSWWPTVEGIPKQCPLCHSLNWNQPRKYKVKKLARQTRKGFVENKDIITERI